MLSPASRAWKYFGAELVAGGLDRLANASRELWGELFTRASFLIGFLIGRGHKQGD
jgi:hypothetical protein